MECCNTIRSENKNQRTSYLCHTKKTQLILKNRRLIFVGPEIYEKLIKGYTEKQWGRNCTELPPFIIKRLPVRFIYDNNYFDIFQGVPIGGYTKMIKRMLEGIEIRLSTDYFDDKTYYDSLLKIVYRSYAFYDYIFGVLEITFIKV